MSFNSCVRSLKLNKKLPVAELREQAKAYEARGMSGDDALRQVVRDRLQLAKMEEANIIRLVREQYEAQGGAKRPAPAAPAPVAPEPVAQPETEAAPAAEAAPQPAPEAPPAPIPLAFYKKFKVSVDVLNEETGVTESVKMPSDAALKSVREDIANLQALIKCMKGGA